MINGYFACIFIGFMIDKIDLFPFLLGCSAGVICCNYIGFPSTQKLQGAYKFCKKKVNTTISPTQTQQNTMDGVDKENDKEKDNIETNENMETK